MCPMVCLDQILQEVEHVVVDESMNSLIIQTRTNSLCDNSHSPYLFVFFKNVLVLISFVRQHFYFYIIFVLKINIVFVSVNEGRNIFVLVIVTVTEI